MSWGVATQNGVSVSLASIVSLSCGATEFSPASLFTSGVQGAWYDPSDYSTLFQDSAGTTPVTAVEQPVGLMLDKSQGATPGPELIVNGDFSGGGTGWTPQAGWSIASGKATGTSTSTNLQTTAGGYTTGKWYVVTFTISDYVGGSVLAWIRGTYASSAASSNGTFTRYIVAGSSSDLFLFTGSGFTGSIDNVSVKEIAGNHAFQATTASRPVLRARYNLLTYSESNYNNGTNWELSSSTFSASGVTDPNGGTNAATFVISAGGAVSGYATLPVTAYVGSIWLKGTGSVVLNLMANGYVSRASTSVTLTSTWTRYTVSGSTQAGDTIAGVRITSAAGATIDVYGRQLVYGSSAGTYQRIAAATDYATAGFLPYLDLITDDSFATNSIDFTATDEMSVCAGITKNSDAAAAILVELSATTASNAGSFYLSVPENTGASGDFGANVRGTTTPPPLASGTVLAPATRVLTDLFDISAPSRTMRLNGTQVATSSTTMGTGNFGNYPLYIGRRNNASLPLNGRIFQMIVVGKTLSASELASTEAFVNQKTGAF